MSTYIPVGTMVHSSTSQHFAYVPFSFHTCSNLKTSATGFKPLNSLFSIMNEFGQIVGQAGTLSQGLDEVSLCLCVFVCVCICVRTMSVFVCV